MNVGVSTACLYPTITELALDNLLGMGIRQLEIFFNTSSELDKRFVKLLKKSARSSGAMIRSLHPYSSMMEPFMFFSNYERRFTDMIEDYKQYFEAAKMLDADLIVIHGDRLPANSPDEKYFERFSRIMEVGKQYGVIVAQENVNLHRSQNVDFLKKMKEWIPDIKFVFDIKQSVRAGYSPYEFVSQLGDSIIHVHASDNNPSNTCLLPGKGDMDYKRLSDIMEKNGCHPSWVIEVYRGNFGEPAELLNAANWLGEVTNYKFTRKK